MSDITMVMPTIEEIDAKLERIDYLLALVKEPKWEQLELDFS